MSRSLLVLDTHVWIWLINGNVERLSAEFIETLEQDNPGVNLGVSAISVWEVGMLEAKGRIRLNNICLDWVREALNAPGVQLLPLTPEIAVESSRLPGELHGDPADRILAATARILGGTLVTQDRRLIDYGEQAYISILRG